MSGENENETRALEIEEFISRKLYCFMGTSSNRNVKIYSLLFLKCFKKDPSCVR